MVCQREFGHGFLPHEHSQIQILEIGKAQRSEDVTIPIKERWNSKDPSLMDQLASPLLAISKKNDDLRLQVILECYRIGCSDEVISVLQHKM
jgi:hypothetical protein